MTYEWHQCTSTSSGLSTFSHSSRCTSLPSRVTVIFVEAVAETKRDTSRPLQLLSDTCDGVCWQLNALLWTMPCEWHSLCTSPVPWNMSCATRSAQSWSSRPDTPSFRIVCICRSLSALQYAIQCDTRHCRGGRGVAWVARDSAFLVVDELRNVSMIAKVLCIFFGLSLLPLASVFAFCCSFQCAHETIVSEQEL